MRWGIMATGRIAGQFAKDLRTAGLELAAVGSRTLEGARAFADEHGIPRAHGSLADLAADPDVDIAYVASPHPAHAEQALAMLRAGKHVLIEKAVTINAAQARAIEAEASARGLVAMEAMWTRFLPHMVRIRELLAAGALGRVHAVLADHAQDLPDDPGHRLNDLALGGGALLDLAIYPVSFAWDVLGAPETVTASATLKETGADAQVSVVLRYADGAMASTFSSSIAAGPVTASILGDDARIEIARTWYAPTSFRVVATDGTVREEYVSDVEGRGMQYEAFEMERRVREGEGDACVLPFGESVAIMGALDDVRRQIGVAYPGESAPGVLEADAVRH